MSSWGHHEISGGAEPGKDSWSAHDDGGRRRSYPERVSSDPHRAVTISLRLDPGPDPIAGALSSEGETIDFSGWIQLAALIEASRRAGGSPAEPPTSAFKGASAEDPLGRPRAPRES